MAETAIGERIERQVRERAARAGAQAAVSLEIALKREFQPHHDTGDTQASISVRPASFTATRIEYLAVVTTPQARFINDGTRAHGPVTAPFLVFTPKGSNRKVFTRWVRGITADPWWDRTIARWSEFVEDALRSI